MRKILTGCLVLMAFALTGCGQPEVPNCDSKDVQESLKTNILDAAKKVSSAPVVLTIDKVTALDLDTKAQINSCKVDIQLKVGNEPPAKAYFKYEITWLDRDARRFQVRITDRGVQQ